MKKQYFIIILIILISVLFITYFYSYNFPLKNRGYDQYSILSITNAADRLSSTEKIDYSIFPNSLINTPHHNFVVYGILTLRKICEINSINASFIFSLFNIIFIYFSIYFFSGFFKISINKKIIILIAISLLYPLNITYSTIGSSLFTFGDIAVSSFSFQLIGLSIFFILLRLSLEYIENKSKSLNVFIISILLFILLNVHLQISFIYLLSVLIFIISDILNKKSISKRIYIILIIMILTGLLLVFIWPFYNWIVLSLKTSHEFQSGAIAQGSKDYLVNKISYYLNFLSISILGIAFLFKEKNKFLKYWIITMSIIIILFLSPAPYKLPMAWRFVGVLKIALIIIIVKNLELSKLKSLVFFVIITLLIVLNIFYWINGINLLLNRNNDYILYNNLKDKNLSDGTIISDDWTSNLIQAIPNYKTYFIMEGHIINPDILIEDVTRIKEFNTVLENSDKTKLNNFLADKKIRYIIIDKKFKSELSLLIIKTNWSEYNVIQDDENVSIIKIY